MKIENSKLIVSVVIGTLVVSSLKNWPRKICVDNNLCDIMLRKLQPDIRFLKFRRVFA